MKTFCDASEFIKPFEEIIEEEVVEKKDKVTPFTFMNALSESKKDLLKEDPDLVNDYNPFITNRGFSYFPDTILYANELNMYPNIPKESQFYYYLHSLRKRKRYSKWFKLEKNDDLELVKQTYKVRTEVAKEFLKILTPENLQAIRDSQSTGELENKINKKVKK